MIRFGRATAVYVVVWVGQILLNLSDTRFMRMLGETGSRIYSGSLFLMLVGTWLLYLVVVYADIVRQEESTAWLVVVFLLGPLGAVLYAVAIHESGEGITPSTVLQRLAAYWFRLQPPGVVLLLAAVVAVFLISPGILKTPCDSVTTVEGPEVLTGYDTSGQVRNRFGPGYSFDRLQLYTASPVAAVNVIGPEGDELYGAALDDPETTITVSPLAAGVSCRTFTVRLETTDGQTSVAEVTAQLKKDYSYSNP